MVLIEDIWLRQVKKVLAFPDVKNLLLDDAQIIEFCVFPAMLRYFERFPKEETYVCPINGELSLPYPDEYTFGALDIRAVDVGQVSPGAGGTFWDIIAYQLMGTGNVIKGTGAYGKRGYNPSNTLEQRQMEMQRARSYQNTFVTIKAKDYPSLKKITAYTSVSSLLNVTWAKYSLNFDDVLFQFRNDVIGLSQANLLLHLADTSGIMSDTNLETTINADALKTRATEIQEKVEEKWLAYPTVLVIHSV